MQDVGTVRTAHEDDLAGLLSLYGDLNPDDPPMAIADAAAVLAQIKGIAGSNVFIIERDGAIVASCTLLVIPNLTRVGKPYALVENVVTSAEHRKRGYGRRVIETAVDAAWDNGCYKVMLLTGSSDPATLQFYGDIGFQQSKTGFQIRRDPVRES